MRRVRAAPAGSFVARGRVALVARLGMDAGERRLAADRQQSQGSPVHGDALGTTYLPISNLCE